MTDRTTRRSLSYIRVSTDEQASSGLGLDAQARKCRAYAELQDYLPTETIEDSGISGAVAPEDRPGLGPALERLDSGGADVLIVASLSRLGRRVVDVLRIADRAHANGWSLAILDMNLDTATPTGRFTLTVLAGVAELEREQIRQRTRDALAAKKAQGARLGRPMTAAGRAAGRRAVQLRDTGLSWRKVAAGLDAEGFRRANGTAGWTPAGARKAMLAVQADDAAAAVRAGPASERRMRVMRRQHPVRVPALEAPAAPLRSVPPRNHRGRRTPSGPCAPRRVLGARCPVPGVPSAAPGQAPPRNHVFDDLPCLPTPAPAGRGPAPAPPGVPRRHRRQNVTLSAGTRGRCAPPSGS